MSEPRPPTDLEPDAKRTPTEEAQRTKKLEEAKSAIAKAAAIRIDSSPVHSQEEYCPTDIINITEDNEGEDDEEDDDSEADAQLAIQIANAAITEAGDRTEAFITYANNNSELVYSLPW